eukprot:s5620_g1.t1
MKKLASDTFLLLRDAVLETFGDVKEAAFKLVVGRIQSSPFPVMVMDKLRKKWASLLSDKEGALIVDEGQPFLLRGLAQWLEIFQDPDVSSLVDSQDSFATGVPLGVGEPLPRTPQVFPPKLVHRKLDESDFNPIADNYASAQMSSGELEQKFRDEEALGRMYPARLPALIREFGEERVRVASMAAIKKPDGSVRPLHDGIHSVKVNNAIRYQDQLQCPGPQEVAAIVRESRETKEAPFAVSADISAAHRLVKIRRKDWAYMACRADSDSATVWVNRVGTFGISSAPYWWAKLFALVGRFVGHLMMDHWFLHLVYVDDLHGVFIGPSKYMMLWIWVLAFELVGTPFGYHKFRGGYASEFVGFQLRYDLGEVGISLKRGTWLAEWIAKAATNKYVVAVRDFSEFLGRLGFVSQLLVWLKPHLAPLYAWAAAVSSGMVGKLPETVILTLVYIASELDGDNYLVSIQRPVHFTGESFRTDAKCTDDSVVLGGWELATGRWFTIDISPEDAPYLFRDGQGAQWASASAELLATLAALFVFGWLDPSKHRKTAEVFIMAGTDNQSNEFLSFKRSTTRWPLMLVNMQLSALLSRCKLGLRLKWRPREENTNADALTNKEFSSVESNKRIMVEYSDLPLALLHRLCETQSNFAEMKAAAKAAKQAGGGVKKRKHEKTPW